MWWRIAIHFALNHIEWQWQYTAFIYHIHNSGMVWWSVISNRISWHRALLYASILRQVWRDQLAWYTTGCWSNVHWQLDYHLGFAFGFKNGIDGRWPCHIITSIILHLSSFLSKFSELNWYPIIIYSIIHRIAFPSFRLSQRLLGYEATVGHEKGAVLRTLAVHGILMYRLCFALSQ